MSATRAAILFPSLGLQILCCVVYLTALTLLTHLISRRISIEKIDSFSSLASISPARICLALVFIDSWLFVFSTAVVIFGIGLEHSPEICSLGITLCVVFYASSKALIYAFLVEKVHIVWGPITGQKRTSSTVYRFCSALMLGYVVIIILMFIGRVTEIEDTGVCFIGLEHFSSIPLIVYDLTINCILTFLFLWPIFHARITNPALRVVALRTLRAATVALVTSAVNITILTALHGRERGWICLTSCATDVSVNAIILAWVARGRDSSSSSVENTPKPVLTDRAGDKAPLSPITIAKPDVLYMTGHRECWSPSTSKSRAADVDIPLSPLSVGSRVESTQRTPGFSGPLGRLFGNQKLDDREIQVTITHERQLSVDHGAQQFKISNDVEREYGIQKESKMVTKT